MAKSISVKVPTKKIISELKRARTEREKAIADYDKAEKAYKKACEEMKSKVVAQIKNGKATVTEVDTYARWHQNEKNSTTFTVTVKIPKSVMTEPESPDRPSAGKHEIEEISHAIRVLEMTDEEFVNASTYNAVIRYL
jgi:hypothetical protein